MVHCKTAVVPDTAVAFNIGTSKLGTRPSAEKSKEKLTPYLLKLGIYLSCLFFFTQVFARAWNNARSMTSFSPVNAGNQEKVAMYTLVYIYLKTNHSNYSNKLLFEDPFILQKYFFWNWYLISRVLNLISFY